MKALKFWVLIAVFLSASFPIQTEAQEGKTLAIRAASYSAIGCVNALLEKKGLKGCWQNALKGGASSSVEHAGIRLVAKGHHWPGVLTHSLGVSMMENMVDGRPLFSRYRVFYLWGSFGYDFQKKDFQPQLLLGRTAMTIGTAFDDKNKFDWKKSLKTGIPFFKTTRNLRGALATTALGVVVAEEKFYESEDPVLRAVGEIIDRHEVIHTLQYRRQRMCNRLIDRYIWGPNYNNAPISFGQDICGTPFIVGGEKGLWEREADAFEDLILNDVINDLKKKIASRNSGVSAYQIFDPQRIWTHNHQDLKAPLKFWPKNTGPTKTDEPLK